MLFGDCSTFAVDIGPYLSRDLRTVDLWAAGKKLTTDDNTAFLPAFTRCLRSAAANVRRHDVQLCPFPGSTPEEIYRLLQADETEWRERFWFLQWGETVDNVSAYAYLDERLVILFEFWRDSHPFPDDLGRVFVAEIEADAFAATLESAIDFIDGGHHYVSGPMPFS